MVSETLTDMDFRKLIAKRAQTLLGLAKHLSQCQSNSEIMIRPFMGELLSQSTQIEELLDAYGAGTNCKWCPFRSLTAAIKHFSEAVRINPEHAEANFHLGITQAKQGRLNEAIKYFSKTLFIDPDNADAHFNMGYAMKISNKTDKALYHYSEAIRTKPDHFRAHTSLGNILASQGNTAEAVSHYSKALTVSPDYEEALNNLAWIYATNKDPRFRNGEKAVQLAEHVCEITAHKDPLQLDTLAAAYAEAGLFTEARLTVQKALKLAEFAGQEKLAEDLKKRLELYSSGLPYYDS